MLFHPERRQLFVFAGQREEFLDDFNVYNIDTGLVEPVVTMETREEQVGVTMETREEQVGVTMETREEQVGVL